MKFSVTLMIQREIEVPDETEEGEEASSTVRELEAAGWSVSVESVEPSDD